MVSLNCLIMFCVHHYFLTISNKLRFVSYDCSATLIKPIPLYDWCCFLKRSDNVLSICNTIGMQFFEFIRLIFFIIF